MLQAESSKAKTFGVVLTPRLSFLSETRINLAVDYFDISVKGEVSQLGARNILFGCYDSQNFATEPLCDLFTRGQTAAPFGINRIFDKYINIASQRNTGIDAVLRIDQGLGSLGKLSLLADMTWQIKDNSRLLPGSSLQSTNGEAGSPKWVGDFRATWIHPSGFSLFYGINVIGATSNVQDFLDANGGEPCINSTVYGTYCPDLTAPATFYHNMSVSQDIAEGRFSITAGVSNLFDTRPPRVSVLNGGEIGLLGPVIYASQYGFTGRRAFVNVSAKF